MLHHWLEQRLDRADVVRVAYVQNVEVLHVHEHKLDREVHAQVDLCPEALDPVAGRRHETVAGALPHLLG